MTILSFNNYARYILNCKAYMLSRVYQVSVFPHFPLIVFTTFYFNYKILVTDYATLLLNLFVIVILHVIILEIYQVSNMAPNVTATRF